MWKKKLALENRTVKMIKISIGILFFQRDLGVWKLVQEKFFKSASPERQKMPFCAVGKLVDMIDLGMENMIPPSNLCCTHLKTSKVLSLKANLTK